ncbi:hypothetical protein DFH08DRAFT_414992 [Mycena albidolilacea]|uniref:F-box domain-containing protein n=1 Tax=Mycena albidolilacea TaxID=1033008 RepID=A0AAD7AII3_9AGAR|nr:hypothetical protein DFH08DRAFT_414992 [Mycena albidolilacea]
MSPLPQELFDAIIDQVRDKETLKACALVATSFLSPSRRNLFREIQLFGVVIGDREPSATLAEFPHLVSYIRDLTIYVWDLVSENILAMAVILRSVQSIESLVIYGGAECWSSLGDEASSALLDCLSRPSLRRLELLYVGSVPAAVISAATAIPVVSFNYVHVDMREEISEQLHASAPAPRLRHLILDAGSEVRSICDFLLHPRNPPYTQQIERLEVRINQPNASHFERIMAACAATLKYLAVNPEDIIQLPLLPSVLEVEIKVWVGYDRRLPAFFSQNISQIASSLPLAETITLVVFVDLVRLGPEIEWADEAPLPIFGPSFMDRTQLLHLRRVHCILRRQSTFGDISALFYSFVPAMESTMPGLRGTGILRCTLDNPPYLAP